VHLKIRSGGNMRSVEDRTCWPPRARPDSDTLNLQAVGVSTDSRGFIEVNEKLQTNEQEYFRARRHQGRSGIHGTFPMISSGLSAKTMSSFDHDALTAGAFVPTLCSLTPQLGRVGLSETEATQQNLEIRVQKMPMSTLRARWSWTKTRGFMKVIVGQKDSQILGAAVLCIEGGEIMSQIQIAMIGKLLIPS